MARHVGEVGEDGKVASKKMRRVREVDWPVTVVDSRGKRVARKLWG